MVRPSHLPDFSDPPLEEVVLGIQFTPPPQYTSIYAKDVWSLYSEEFPNVEEHPALEPVFETFGGANSQPSIAFKVGPPPARGRLWFVSKEESHLIQFQEDRFLLNWRKRPKGDEYPHFESIASTFVGHLERLEGFFQSNFKHVLEINQAEISYINIIPVKYFSDTSDWMSLWGCGELNLEGININFKEIFKDENDVAYARLTHELQSVVTPDGKARALRLGLTFRGRPNGTDAAAGMNFLETGRDSIVMRFSEITTEKAHQVWGRQK